MTATHINKVVYPGKLSELFYFAYGSNMNERQLASRGIKPSSIITARLPGHRVGFFGYSRVWDGGMETIVPEPRADVWGVLCQLSFEDGEVLDVWQDVRQDGGGVYFHYPATVIDAGGREHLVLLYKKDILGVPRPPSREYLDFIVEGALGRGLPEAYITGLRQTESIAAGYPVPRRKHFNREFLLVGCRGGCGGG
ncbi:gamma-glutamylcyclotransferase [Termitidicoccus mucosus]|uniref:AnfR protein n=1 Tax=Termitidicoccus mucosus TaxID=1184151 RepID=A0A178INU9_9BACT|nr:AnfR protein [Opitutaceae bacterium TSB47]